MVELLKGSGIIISYNSLAALTLNRGWPGEAGMVYPRSKPCVFFIIQRFNDNSAVAKHQEEES